VSLVTVVQSRDTFVPGVAQGRSPTAPRTERGMPRSAAGRRLRQRDPHRGGCLRRRGCPQVCRGHRSASIEFVDLEARRSATRTGERAAKAAGRAARNADTPSAAAQLVYLATPTRPAPFGTPQHLGRLYPFWVIARQAEGLPGLPAWDGLAAGRPPDTWLRGGGVEKSQRLSGLASAMVHAGRRIGSTGQDSFGPRRVRSSSGLSITAASAAAFPRSSSDEYLD
jgi:hypothetical protein